jgi:glutamyl-tRNA reductase
VIVLTGISHHTAAIEIREQLALTDDEAKRLAANLATHEHVAEVFVVSTCNRVEVICSTRDESESSAKACQAACRAAFVERCAQSASAIYSHTG